jgi:GH25 family lysozyme M1 (1,4-beta-N-acetylmuramidase)
MGSSSARLAWLVLAVLVAGCGASPESSEPTATTAEALQQCETVSVEGIDVSNGQGKIDWATVKAAGVDFAIMKATQGTYDTQSTFAANWAGSKAAGVIRSPYHFFDPTEDGAAQAHHFLSVVGAMGPGDLPPMLDIECPTGSADTTCLGTGTSDAASAADIATRMWAFIDTVQQATGKMPIIYTYESYFSSNGIDTTGLDAYPLYIADPVSGKCFDVPAPWTSAVIWQYSFTGTVSGISGDVDRDRFIGTLAELQQFAQTTVGADAGADAGPEAGTDGGRDAGPEAGGVEAGPLPEGGSDAGDLDQGGGGKGCGCRVAGFEAGELPRLALGAFAVLALAGAWRRRHSSVSVLAGRSKEPPCRRPTSAKG